MTLVGSNGRGRLSPAPGLIYTVTLRNGISYENHIFNMALPVGIQTIDCGIIGLVQLCTSNGLRV